MSIQRYFSLTKYGEVIVKNSVLIMQSCKNVDLNLILVAATTDVFNFPIINSLMESWGVHLTWLNCKYYCDIEGPVGRKSGLCVSPVD